MIREGIAVAGSLIVDTVKEIERYPETGMLANIVGVGRSVGGCMPNTAINLAKMKSGIPIQAYGKAGKDENGRYVIERLREEGVDTEGVILTEEEGTSFSDVMSVRGTGERTFFHYRGANKCFGPEDVAVDKLDCKIFHIGYLLLLDRFDLEDVAYGTVMARFLRELQMRGILTSIDTASDTGGTFAQKITPALRFCDYTIMNEIEACAVSGMLPRDEKGRLLTENIKKTLEMFLQAGVRKRAVVHCPEAGFCMDADTGFCMVPSWQLPNGFIRGSVGAGDAFCAGCLREIYLGKSAEEMLEFAACAAAANLSNTDSVSGMRDWRALEEMTAGWKKQEYIG